MSKRSEVQLDRGQIITLYTSVKELSTVGHTLDVDKFSKYYGTDVCSLQVQVMSGSHSEVQPTRTTVS